MSSSIRDITSNVPPLPYDILQEIAQYCNRRTLKAYCSSSRFLREAGVPFLFRTSYIRCGTNDRLLPGNEHLKSQPMYEAWAKKRTENFEQLAASGYAKYVRQLSYFIFDSWPPGDFYVHYWGAQYHATAWPIFIQNLGCLTQLQELRFVNVDVSDEFIDAMGTLQRLRNLSLERHLVFSCTMERAKYHHVRPTGNLDYWPFFNPDLNDANSLRGAAFVAEACSSLTSLHLCKRIITDDGLGGNFCRILNNCQLLEELYIDTQSIDPRNAPSMDKFAADASLEPTAMPRLRLYDGPACYAFIVKVRPVHDIHVDLVPAADLDEDNLASWVQRTFSGTTVAVESFCGRFEEWAIDYFVGAVPATFPSLREVKLDVDSIVGEYIFDSVAESLREGYLVIPKSLRTLSLIWDDVDAEIVPEVDFKKIDVILSMTERLGNLESVTIGKNELEYVVCTKSNVEPSQWKMQRKHFGPCSTDTECDPDSDSDPEY